LYKAIKKLNITTSWAESINTASISKKYIEEVGQGHKCSACKEHLMLFSKPLRSSWKKKKQTQTKPCKVNR